MFFIPSQTLLQLRWSLFGRRADMRLSHQMIEAEEFLAVGTPKHEELSAMAARHIWRIVRDAILGWRLESRRALAEVTRGMPRVLDHRLETLRSELMVYDRDEPGQVLPDAYDVLAIATTNEAAKRPEQVLELTIEEDVQRLDPARCAL